MSASKDTTSMDSSAERAREGLVEWGSAADRLRRWIASGADAPRDTRARIALRRDIELLIGTADRIAALEARVRELEGADGQNPSGRAATREPISRVASEYRDFVIDHYAPPIPYRGADWQFWHKDYDGPEDNRCGHAASLEAAKAEIDQWHEDHPEELPEGWQAAQAARCGCRGTDDLCQCQNEYNPRRYGLQVTEKCADCGRLASDLTHRLCQRPDCPIPAHIAKSRASAGYGLPHPRFDGSERRSDRLTQPKGDDK